MKKFYWLLYSLIFSFSGCIATPLPAKNISLVSWNVQTFFDAYTEGCEYSEFKKSEYWNTNVYQERLKKLCQAIKDINADVFVLEEIENSGILYDISNELAGYSWSGKKSWTYGAFSKNKGDAIGCGILSRFPLSEMTIHNIYIPDKKQPSMRPVIKVTLDADNNKICLLVNHWKSKSGGEEESEIWRNWQEAVLNSLFLENTELPVIACGDFNRDIKDFNILMPAENTNLKNEVNLILKNKVNPLSSEESRLYTPWISGKNSFIAPGSYYFNSEWERIDHFICNEKININNFSVLTDAPWCDENDIPIPFKLYTGKGYSDHLPIKCFITIN